jgi:nicotinamide mononucleotide transporter
VTVDLWPAIAAAWHDTTWIEFAAAVLAVLYLLLAIRQRPSCWTAAFISSCLYVWVYFSAHLYMESVLSAFYAAMAVYGYSQWQGRKRRQGVALTVSRWPFARHAAWLSGVIALALLNSFFLRHYTPAARPFVDSMVTWSSVYATFLVTRKVYDNWYWWLAIDSVSACLYFIQHLYVTMLLFCVYLILIFAGMREWRRSLPRAALAIP